MFGQPTWVTINTDEDKPLPTPLAGKGEIVIPSTDPRFPSKTIKRCFCCREILEWLPLQNAWDAERAEKDAALAEQRSFALGLQAEFDDLVAQRDGLAREVGDITSTIASNDVELQKWELAFKQQYSNPHATADAQAAATRVLWSQKLLKELLEEKKSAYANAKKVAADFAKARGIELA